jgi:FAD/FMN-containing dehydrogenase
MTVTSLAPSAALPLDALAAIIGAENVIVDPKELTFYSTDVYRRADVDAAIVIRPGTAEEVAEAVKLCTSQGLAIIPRGGGLSYTGGFLPMHDNSVIVDLLRLDRIIEINATDMFVTVECGVTWKALYEALKPLGLRTPYFGPMSGYASTVGGALSQGSIFLGSTQHGTTSDSVLSIDVVIADGSLVSTGSAGGIHQPSPFFRHYGPDLTGLFLNDAGALGLKTRATLRLLAAPEVTGAVSFTFDSHADLLAAMSEVARRGLAAECYGADPYIWGMRLWDDDLARDVKRLVGVATGGKTMLGGIKDAARIAFTGRRALKDVEYAMNVAIDGRTQAEVDHALGEVRAIAAPKGREVEATVPITVRGTPFLPPNDILGPKGQRWAPTHGIAPHSRIVQVTDALYAFFEARSAIIDRHAIEWGFVTFAISTTAILIEPMLYWPGAREAYHERIIEASVLAKLPDLAPDPDAAAAVKQLREDLATFWMEHGCAHLQIGKTYRYLESRQPATRRLIEQIKAVVDPGGLLNPGALGLD